MSPNTSVTRLAASQSEQLTQALIGAFSEDPAFRYLLPDDRTREKRLSWLIRTGVGYGLSFGEIYSTEGVDGGAIWIPPANRRFSFRHVLQSGLLAAPFRLGWGAFRRLQAITAAIDKVHQRVMPDRHWYLMVLGVAPSKQGRGLGHQLLAAGLRQVDLARLPCYLETFQETTVPFYEKHGFRLVSQGEVPHGPRFWSMVKPAGVRSEGDGVTGGHGVGFALPGNCRSDRS